MRINQNIAAFNAYRNLSRPRARRPSRLEKLSSGFRINRAADDASGLVNSENLRARSVASRRPSATPRTASASCRPLKVR